jgi:RNA polymerase sigma-70 factor, ECF subfamily
MDAATLDAARAGDATAMDRLLRSLHDRVLGVCRRMLGNDADAADASQEALIAIVRGLPAFDGRSNVTTWAYRIAVNASLDEIRRRQRRPHPGLPEAVFERTSPGSFEDDLVRHRVVDAALAQLPPDYRAAVVLRDLCDLDYAEIAEVLDIPPGTVRSRIARGRAAVAQVLGRTDDEAGNQPGRSGRQSDDDRARSPEPRSTDLP